MKTLYIPTTTLNFNNIMSSESISPKAFYAERGFGYKNWHSIIENPFDNSILLYEEIPVVERPQSDYDDYPMIIAVCFSEEQFEDMCFTGTTDGIWQYDKTIYLNPLSSTIFFDTEEHKHIALSKSESSAETKMVTIYKQRMFCAQMNIKYDISSCRDVALCQDCIFRDQRINKLKGLLYGYFIGAAMSMNERDVAKLNILNNIKNILAAILASLNGRATREQEISLQNQFDRLKKFDPLRVELARIIEDSSIGLEEKLDYIIAVTENRSYKYSSNTLRHLLDEVQKGKQEQRENSAISWINNVINSHIEESKSRKTLLSQDSGELDLASLSLVTISSSNVREGKPQELFIAVANDVLTTNKYNGKISTFKFELATDITLKAKEVFAEEWNDSCQAKTYLNALRRHINGEPFNQQWNSGVLSSIASVILKGDDWERLLEFMQTKGIADYRLAFAIYGALNGFANLTRDFSDILLKENEVYVSAVYQFFHKKIHEEDACIANVPEFTKPHVNATLRKDVLEVYNTLNTNQQKAYATSIERALELEAAQGDFDAYLYILNNLIKPQSSLYKEMYKVLHLPESQKKALKDVVNGVLRGFQNSKYANLCLKARHALELEEMRGDALSFCCMLDDLKVSKNVQKKFFSHFGLKQETTKASSPIIERDEENYGFGALFNQQENLDLNGSQCTKRLLVEDDNAIFLVRQIQTNAKITNRLEAAFKDFLKGYAPNGFYYKHSDQYKRNNSEVIDHFHKWCFSDRNHFYRFNRNSQEEVEAISQLIHLLKKYYPC